MMKIKYYPATVWKVFKKDLPMKSRLPLGQLKQFNNNYELTMVTLKGETFAGSKIQKETVFYFVIDALQVLYS